MREYWESDNAEARFLAEHGSVGQWDDDEFLANFGNEGLLPEWPPTVNLPGICVPLSEEPWLRRGTCKTCKTAVALREGEWRHELGFKARLGCLSATP